MSRALLIRWNCPGVGGGGRKGSERGREVRRREVRGRDKERKGLRDRVCGASSASKCDRVGNGPIHQEGEEEHWCSIVSISYQIRNTEYNQLCTPHTPHTSQDHSSTIDTMQIDSTRGGAYQVVPHGFHTAERCPNNYCISDSQFAPLH